MSSNGTEGREKPQRRFFFSFVLDVLSQSQSDTTPSISAFLFRALRPVISVLTAQNATTFHLIDDTVLIAHLTAADTDLAASFNALATRHRHQFTFAVGDGVLTARAAGAPLPSIMCFNNAHPATSTTSIHTPESGTNLVALEAFLATCATPLIDQMTRRSELKHLQSGKSLLYIFTSSEEQRDAARDGLAELAKQFAEYIAFVTVDTLLFPDMAAALGLKTQAGQAAGPALALQNPQHGMIFAFDSKKDITMESVGQWISDIAEGKIRPTSGGEDDQQKKGGRHDEL